MTNKVTIRRPKGIDKTHYICYYTDNNMVHKMLEISAELKEKIEVLDKILSLVDKERLEEILNEIQVFHKLKQEHTSAGQDTLSSIIQHINHLETMVVDLTMANANLNDDIKLITKILNGTRHSLNANSSLDILTNKHGVF